MIRLLLLGTGNMARNHVAAFRLDPRCAIVGAIDTNADRLAAFIRGYDIPHGFASLEAAIEWGEFDAVANVTPDPAHHPTTLALIAEGKHVLCEKPLATSYGLAREMADAAQRRGVTAMVNLVYRGSPALQRANAILASGAIGTLRHFDASYYQSWLAARYWGDWREANTTLWKLSTAHGSKGVVGDIGIHIVDFATYGAGSPISYMSSRIKAFDKALDNRIGEYVLDANDSFVMSVELSGGAIGTIAASRWATGYSNDLQLRLFATDGALEVQTDGQKHRLRICDGDDLHQYGQRWREIECPNVPTTYRSFIDRLIDGAPADPDFDRAAELQAVLDCCIAGLDGDPRRIPA